MKGRLIRAFGFLAALSLSTLAVQALPAGWSLEGCWSPYPNCAGGADIYVDSSGQHWNCGRCYTNKNPSPSTCTQTSNAVHSIGYWCS